MPGRIGRHDGERTDRPGLRWPSTARIRESTAMLVPDTGGLGSSRPPARPAVSKELRCTAQARSPSARCRRATECAGHPACGPRSDRPRPPARSRTKAFAGSAGRFGRYPAMSAPTVSPRFSPGSVARPGSGVALAAVSRPEPAGNCWPATGRCEPGADPILRWPGHGATRSGRRRCPAGLSVLARRLRGMYQQGRDQRCG